MAWGYSKSLGSEKTKILMQYHYRIYPPKNDGENYDENGFLWVKPDNLNEFNEIIHTNERVSVQGLRDNFLIPKGSILVCSIGTIGKIGIAGQDLITNQQINSFIFGRHIKNSFAKYMVFSAKRIFDFLANDNVVRILNASTQKHIFFAVPPLAEQTAIAHYLDRETAKIDALLQKQAELLAKLSEKRTTLITHAVTKGLNPNVAMKNSGVQWLGDIPSHWEIIKNKFILNFSKGLSTTKENLVDDGIPCVNYGEIHSKYGFEVIPEKHYLKCVPETYLENAQNALLKNGDFVFADTSEDIKGSGNFTYLNSDTPTFAGYHTIIARLKSNDVCSRFLAYVFSSEMHRNQVRAIVKGVKVFSITQAFLKNTYVYFPPIDEQTAIAEFLDFETAKIDALCDKIREMSERLTEYRTTLISDAVTGKIKVIP